MVWKKGAPERHEASKIRFEIVPYTMGSCLDIGCGPDKVWPHAFGIDSMRDKELFGLAFVPDMVVPDARRLPFRDDDWDSVFSSHTLEHIEDYKAALREWWRVIKPGGYLVLYLPDKRVYPNIGEEGSNIDHKHDFLPDDILEAMKEVSPDWTLMEYQDRHDGLEYSFLQVYRKEVAGSGHKFPAMLPRPAKKVGIMRPGGNGDALWISGMCEHFKSEGYHVTVYTGKNGEQMLRHDPNVDRIIALRRGVPADDQEIAYCLHEAPKYDKWVNLLHSVESNLLPHPSDHRFYLPPELRHKLMNRNYLDTVNEWAGIEIKPRQKFYRSDEEAKAAKILRDMSNGPLVVINPAGSGPVKYWPYSQKLMELLAERGVYSVVLGDVRDENLIGVDPYGSVIGMEWPIRMAVAFTMEADAVVAVESAIANAVAFEPMLKVVTLSHSSVENLTRDWVNCASIEPQRLDCYPCHRVHGADYAFCKRDRNTGAAACQALASAEMIAALVIDYLEANGKLQRKAA